jgi:hypothetical protein
MNIADTGLVLRQQGVAPLRIVLSRLLFSLMMMGVAVETASGQDILFADIPWNSNVSLVKDALVSKGYTFVKKDVDGDLIFEKQAFGYKSRFMALLSPENGLVKWSISIPTPDPKAFDAYDVVVAQMQRKYGKPDFSLENYESPYEKGDGYEEQAVKLGKATIATVWKNTGEDGVGVQISENLAVIIFYESRFWIKEADRRGAFEASDF